MQPDLEEVSVTVVDAQHVAGGAQADRLEAKFLSRDAISVPHSLE
jgi:hypothetical protein